MQIYGSYHVLRDNEEYTRVTRVDEADDYSTIDTLVLLQPDPWGDYRRFDQSLLPEVLRA